MGVGSEGKERWERVKRAARPLKTIFGQIEVERMAYWAPPKGVAPRNSTTPAERAISSAT